MPRPEHKERAKCATFLHITFIIFSVYPGFFFPLRARRSSRPRHGSRSRRLQPNPALRAKRSPKSIEPHRIGSGKRAGGDCFCDAQGRVYPASWTGAWQGSSRMAAGTRFSPTQAAGRLASLIHSRRQRHRLRCEPWTIENRTGRENYRARSGRRTACRFISRRSRGHEGRF